MLNEKDYDELPPFLMSSVPKSGTHLLHQILTGIPYVKMDILNAQKKFFIDSRYQVGIEKILQDHFNRLQALTYNEFGLGHIWYTTGYKKILKTLNMKHIFLHRDPRDVLVSMSHYIPKSWKDHPFHEDFNTKHKTMKERHLALISGVRSPIEWPDFYRYNVPFYEWLIDQDTLHVSYEDLVRSTSSREEVLFQIVRYLWDGLKPPCSYEEMVSKMIENINEKSSYTFREGGTGGWKKEFDNEVKTAFKLNAGELLTRFDYEKNNDW